VIPLSPVRQEHFESIRKKRFLFPLLSPSWRRLIIIPLVLAVSAFVLAGCASTRRQQNHSPDKPFFDTPNVDNLN
jgi:hypothetical protein